MKPDLTKTTETIATILRGMNIFDIDYVLSVGGAGDQAFAMMARGARVSLCDILEYQVDFIKEQTELLRKKDYASFMSRRLNVEGKNLDELFRLEMEKGTQYFTPEILEKVNKNIDKLKISYCCILELADREKDFNKIYLSSALGELNLELCRIRPAVEKLLKRLPTNGLIYVANSGVAWDWMKDIKGIYIDENLTRKAQDGIYKPIVIRKK